MRRDRKSIPLHRVIGNNNGVTYLELYIPIKGETTWAFDKAQRIRRLLKDEGLIFQLINDHYIIRTLSKRVL